MLAGSLIMTGMVVAQLGAFLWWVDREVADPEQLASITATIVRDPEFRAAVTPEIADRLSLDQVADGLPEVERSELDTAVDDVLTDPRVVADIADAVARVAASVMGTGTGDGDHATLDLGAIHAAVVEQLGAIDPELGRRVAAVDPPAVITLDTSRFPDLGTPFAALSLAWMILLGGGVGLALAGMVVHPRPGKGLRRIGVIAAIGAGIQLGLAWIVTDVVVPNLPGDGLATAGAIGLRLVTEGWRVQSFTQLALGAVVAVAGHVWLWLPALVGRGQPATARYT